MSVWREVQVFSFCKSEAIIINEIGEAFDELTLKHRETHDGCEISTAAIDVLVLKHQVINILNAY